MFQNWRPDTKKVEEELKELTIVARPSSKSEGGISLGKQIIPLLSKIVHAIGLTQLAQFCSEGPRGRVVETHFRPNNSIAWRKMVSIQKIHIMFSDSIIWGGNRGEIILWPTRKI